MPGHRPRLPARHPREADRRASPSATAASTQRSSHRFATYRSRGAIRDVGKALGLPYAELERHRARLGRLERAARRRGAAAAPRRRPQADVAALARVRRALPRDRRPAAPHLRSTRAGWCISSRPLVELVPVQPAAMAGRQMCQWDKDSCADAGFLKIDLLGLGMLSAVEDCVDQIAQAAAASRSTSHGSRSTTRPSTRRSSAPTRSATSRSRAARRCRACCARGRRTSTT